MTQFKTTQASKGGEWVLPVIVGDTTLYCVQINKTQAEKDDIENIMTQYNDANITVYEYEGKGGKPVYLVEKGQALKQARPLGEKKQAQYDALIAQGLTAEVALSIVKM